MSAGIQHWYYTKSLPSRAVAVAQISVPPLAPAQLTSVNNVIYQQGTLGVWRSTAGFDRDPDFTAPDYLQPVTISGDTAYFVANQFFELTNVTSPTSGSPLFYQHDLLAGVSQVSVLDQDGNLVSTDFLQQGSRIYHSMDGGAYTLRYVTLDGFMHTDLLRYDPVFTQSAVTAAGTKYQFTGRLLTIGYTSPVIIRFTTPNGYQVMPMYGYLPNVPWYPRIRFGMQPPPIDWASQRFVVSEGYLQGNYVSGKVLNSSLVEFERKNILYDPDHLPDLLIFDKNNVLKYALDGSSPSSALRKGTLYTWKRGRIQSFDPANGRVNLTVNLDPTDIVYGFFNYYEPDVVFTDLDVNPFTNPAVKDRLVQFYVKFDGADPHRNLFYQVLDSTGAAIAGLTNDASPGTGTAHVFSTLMVGSAVSAAQFTMTDIRVRGGGLAEQYQSIPQATSFFDLGYWDGKPYPIGGALAVYLPLSILDSLSRSEVQGMVDATIPLGAIAVIRYFDEQGLETV